MNNEFCDRCELDFGSKREDGTVVCKAGTTSCAAERPLCGRCLSAIENAAEERWMQRENDRFFGG